MLNKKVEKLSFAKFTNDDSIVMEREYWNKIRMTFSSMILTKG